eukprot:CAMPEP_0173408556 /NCGR_PEP_ID=MMETSP1356-20130122/70040_1 /TAXON_ID=77927 ORGANISM="Hemiselmis virescens, Strain PCC157" /NCGR_SAMPLE_ID=MMETSP1356 /ASSEMBLY_ACC=CAM_ASM_000847 /LENGTH=52 /DNA_ID=CAMNT_0014369885 /DNA_START=81 /DNA_END=235 /DNA_ORIENTATION=+
MGGAALLLAALERPHAFKSLCLFEPIVLNPASQPSPQEICERLSKGASKRKG